MKHSSTFVAQCEGKQKMDRAQANALARKISSKAARTVEAYQCDH